MINSDNKETTREHQPIIAIVGNMNVGKTCLFNALCGSNTNSINMSGSTVSVGLDAIGPVLLLEGQAL